jgi:DNA-binding PadR family transcriptional regulator
MFACKKHWMRNTALVPKGFIRYHVLEAISEKPMSGSELTEAIEKHTGGFWKPSPGSIYPLLSMLQGNGYINELPTENGLKRYELTQSGKSLLEEQKKIRAKYREEGGFLHSSFFDSVFMKLPPEQASEIRAALKRFAIVSFHLGNTLRENYSEQALKEVMSVLEEASTKLGKINANLKGEKNESSQSK